MRTPVQASLALDFWLIWVALPGEWDSRRPSAIVVCQAGTLIRQIGICQAVRTANLALIRSSGLDGTVSCGGEKYDS